MKRKQKKLYIALGVVVFILVGILGLIATKNYPQIFVGTNFLSARSVETDLAVAKRIDPKSTDDQAIAQLIKVQEERQMVFGTSLSQPTVVSEAKFLTFNKDDEYKNVLQTVFDNNQSEFLDFLVAPQVYDALLREKYNSNFTANKQVYTRAQDALTQISQGHAFEDVAKADSDDKVSAQLGGDMGFIQEGQILPELFQVIQKSKVGEVNKQIVVSRLGYHILYPVETADKDGNKLWHVKQIFIQTTGYDAWLNSQLNNFHVWRLSGK